MPPIHETRRKILSIMATRREMYGEGQRWGSLLPACATARGESERDGSDCVESGSASGRAALLSENSDPADVTRKRGNDSRLTRITANEP